MARGDNFVKFFVKHLLPESLSAGSSFLLLLPSAFMSHPRAILLVCTH